MKKNFNKNFLIKKMCLKTKHIYKRYTGIGTSPQKIENTGYMENIFFRYSKFPRQRFIKNRNNILLTVLRCQF